MRLANFQVWSPAPPCPAVTGCAWPVQYSLPDVDDDELDHWACDEEEEEDED